MRRREVLGLAGAASGALVLAACAEHAMEPIAPRSVSPEAIDEDPFALLPPKILGLADVDLTAAFATSLGADLVGFLQRVFPLGPDSNLVVGRDATRMLGALYAMQGIDFCALVLGRFDVASIQRAIEARAAAGASAAFVRTRYGEHDIVTSGNTGFAVLSAKTLVCGSETCIRRVIDRIRFKRLERSIPAWMIAANESGRAPFHVVADFGAGTVLDRGPRPASKVARGTRSIATPIIESAAYRFPFLSSLRLIRLRGNYAPPGLNFAGAFTYATPERAATGAEALKSASQLAQWANMFGAGGSLPPIQVAVRGQDVGFVQPIETEAARALLSLVKAYAT